MKAVMSAVTVVFTLIGILGALIAGYFLWMYFHMLTHGTIFGRPDVHSYALAYAPIVGFAVPAAALLLFRMPAVAAWVLALAPLLSVANFAACMVAMGLVGVTELNTTGPLLFSLIWIIPFARLTRYGWRHGLRTTPPEPSGA
jgi:hypothetical protein